MDRPILFSSPMVKALLAGTKTQTRRVSKKQDWPEAVVRRYPRQHGAGYEVGDRLWVRETGNWRGPMRNLLPGAPHEITFIFYAADSERGRSEFFDDINKPAIFMPRWASRITLTITDVRVQRLQEITEADAQAEGVLWVPGHGEITPSELNADPGYSNFLNCKEGYQVLWDHLNSRRGFGWDTNPWVVALTFTIAHRNIDAEVR